MLVMRAAEGCVDTLDVTKEGKTGLLTPRGWFIAYYPL
jgi:hypothetical protein